MMSATTKDSSLFTQLLSRTFSHRTSQVATAPSATEKQQQSLSPSSDSLQNTCSSQAFFQSGLDWGRREPYLRLAHVFDTNNY
ncbi:hypothetical protein COOONC_03223 [Cooperia oncophora]